MGYKIGAKKKGNKKGGGGRQHQPWEVVPLFHPNKNDLAKQGYTAGLDWVPVKPSEKEEAQRLIVVSPPPAVVTPAENVMQYVLLIYINRSEG